MRLYDKIKLLFEADAWKGYLREATGNPTTLTDVMAGDLEGVTVYGAEGGVGDATANLGAPSSSLPLTKNGVHFAYVSGTYTVSGTAAALTNQGIAAFDVLPSTTYTYMVIPVDNSDLPQTYIYDATNTRTILAPGSHTIGNFTTAANTARIVVGCSAASNTTPDYRFRVMVVEGEYTAETMPEYEPYGYKIPVLMGGTNLLDEDDYIETNWVWGSNGQYVQNNKIAPDASREYRLSIKSGTAYTMSAGHIAPVDPSAADKTPYIRVAQFDANGNFITREALSLFGRSLVSFTTEARTVRIVITTDQNAIFGYESDFMLVEGTYTAETMPHYQPYVPNKTINLYMPQQLTATTDTLTANIGTKTATLTVDDVSTDVSAMQDWEQDWTLNKGDNTVSIGTTVQPSAVDWRYWSSKRATE